jgi:hypothetical protein
MKYKLFFLVVIVTTSYNVSLAQNLLFKEFADLDQVKKLMRYDFPPEDLNKNGNGYSINPAFLAKPVQKIALVTFYLQDPGTLNASAPYRVTDETGQKFIDGFYNQGVDALVQQFKAEGIELLLPNQFLDSPEKKEFYKTYEVEHTSVMKEKTLTEAMYNGKTSSIERLKITASNSGMKPLFLFNETFFAKDLTPAPEMMTSSGILTDKKMTTSLGFDLAQKLNVDAVLCVWVVSYKTSPNFEHYGLGAISGYMFGPNPIQKEAGDDKAVAYARGLFYCGTRAAFKDLMIYQNIDKKRKPEAPNYAGFENAMTAMASKMSAYLKTGKRK